MPSEVDGYDFDDGYDFGIEHAISLVEDLDEPVVPQELEKPVVPQFVADLYESIKDDFEYKVYLTNGRKLFIDDHDFNKILKEM